MALDRDFLLKHVGEEVYYLAIGISYDWRIEPDEVALQVLNCWAMRAQATKLGRRVSRIAGHR